jgi:parvulin-like peptidyl-prolyl isomerase
MKRWLREPLLHFLLLGCGLFAVYHFVQREQDAESSSKQIQLSLGELTQLALQFKSQWKREPTVQEFERLLEGRVQEEILYREALALDLEKDDTIVRRRMAQKMQFVTEDLAAAREPASAELKSWFGKNRAEFAQPSRVSFRHLYFSPDRRGERARNDAASALVKLVSQPEDSTLADSLADPFMFQDYFRDRTPEQLSKEFGPQFALAVGKLAPNAWQGPIESGLGWHLVFIDTLIAGHVPTFEEIEPEVKGAWQEEQKTLSWQEAYRDMRAKYTVLLPAPAEGARPSPVSATTPKASFSPGESVQ